MQNNYAKREKTNALFIALYRFLATGPSPVSSFFREHSSCADK